MMKEKLDQMTQIKKQLWHYQNREGDLLDRENNLLEKEEACKKVCFPGLCFFNNTFFVGNSNEMVLQL